MMKKLFLIFALMGFISVTTTLHAEQLPRSSEQTTDSFSSRRAITGIVIGSDKVPILGASVVVRGTTNGVATDVNGQYRIRASSGDRLMYSFIGYRTQEIVVKNGIYVINVQLEEDLAASSASVASMPIVNK